MGRCIICGAEVSDRHDYCETCFKSAIGELNRKYGKEGPSEPGKDSGEAPASEPLTENTHH